MRMTLILFAAGAAAYVLSQKKAADRARPRTGAAFAPNQPQSGLNPVRDAGPEAMRDGAARSWSSVDEASDQSFPASDPPASY